MQEGLEALELKRYWACRVGVRETEGDREREERARDGSEAGSTSICPKSGSNVEEIKKRLTSSKNPVSVLMTGRCVSIGYKSEGRKRISKSDDEIGGLRVGGRGVEEKAGRQRRRERKGM